MNAIISPFVDFSRDRATPVGAGEKPKTTPVPRPARRVHNSMPFFVGLPSVVWCGWETSSNQPQSLQTNNAPCAATPNMIGLSPMPEDVERSASALGWHSHTSSLCMMCLCNDRQQFLLLCPKSCLCCPAVGHSHGTCLALSEKTHLVYACKRRDGQAPILAPAVDTRSVRRLLSKCDFLGISA